MSNNPANPANEPPYAKVIKVPPNLVRSIPELQRAVQIYCGNDNFDIQLRNDMCYIRIHQPGLAPGNHELIRFGGDSSSSQDRYRAPSTQSGPLQILGADLESAPGHDVDTKGQKSIPPPAEEPSKKRQGRDE
ncbi:hypothetical protein SCUP515_10437 [Seiridium cupressi]